MFKPRTIKEIHNALISRIRVNMNWDGIKTVNGQTQGSELGYKNSIIKAMEEEGAKIGEFAPPQKPKDVRKVTWPGISGEFEYEFKKVDVQTGFFMLNDTFPENKTTLFYIFIRTKNKSVDIRTGRDLQPSCEHVPADQYSTTLDELNACVEKLRSSSGVSEFKELFVTTVKLLKIAVKSGMLPIYDYGEMFKYATDFDLMKSRPRPNWSLHTDILNRQCSE